MADDVKTIAAITTVYRKWSHADVILTKILKGYDHQGGEKPKLRLAGLYVDQFPKNDMSRDLAKEYGFRLAPTIAEALTLGTGKLAVDGVMIIGEHGEYPDNEKGQKLYPRRRFFDEAAKVFEASGRSVPVFNDKHLSARWDDAKAVYDRSRKLMIPFLAGSSIPVTWRKPALTLPRNCTLTGVLQLGYGPFEGYGFHALEGLQCMVERRKGGETGVKAVTCIQGPALRKALTDGTFARPLLDELLRMAPAHANGDPIAICEKTADAGLFLIEYRDGFKAGVAMLNGYLHEGDGGAFVFAGTLADQPKPVSSQFYLQQPDPFAHFGYLIRAFESMLRTGHAPYPVERTLLTTGILDALMTSRHRKGERIETPHLAIRYTPTDWPFATDPIPKPIPSSR